MQITVIIRVSSIIFIFAFLLQVNLSSVAIFWLKSFNKEAFARVLIKLIHKTHNALHLTNLLAETQNNYGKSTFSKLSQNIHSPPKVKGVAKNVKWRGEIYHITVKIKDGGRTGTSLCCWMRY